MSLLLSVPRAEKVGLVTVFLVKKENGSQVPSTPELCSSLPLISASALLHYLFSPSLPPPHQLSLHTLFQSPLNPSISLLSLIYFLYFSQVDLTQHSVLPLPTYAYRKKINNYM